MAITNIISAIGNNSSIYPLLVRDCGIEVPSKIIISRKENLKESKEIAKDATRERFIDEYTTSAVWLGGIPAVEYVADKIINKKGFNSKVSPKLFKEENFQGLEYNINKFEKSAPEEVKDLLKVKNNKNTYQKLLSNKFIAATAIPILVMGFILPPLNFALTRKIRARRNQQKLQNENMNTPKTSFTSLDRDVFKSFKTQKNKNINFTGNMVSTIANLRTVDKMAITDGGLTVGRVTTSRKKGERYFNAFRMIGSMFLNFVAPKYIAKFLDKTANKVFGINVNLDPAILADKNFLKAIKENKFELPKSNSEKDIFDFIDEKPESLFSKFAQKENKISYLKNGIRDPRKYIDIKDLQGFKEEFEEFIKSAKKSKNIEKFMQKAKYVKCINILTNVVLSSLLLAVALPKATYKFIKLTTGSYLDPGLAPDKK